ncbi:hypothetical protein AMECASPLE_021059 [Ameca splendens]|uniref:Uncharacterized protein n=1 Tax=Ameca splendens TaxID=208324 RepID=A0ABV0ZQ34_9TELE
MNSAIKADNLNAAVVVGTTVGHMGAVSTADGDNASKRLMPPAKKEEEDNRGRCESQLSALLPGLRGVEVNASAPLATTKSQPRGQWGQMGSRVSLCPGGRCCGKGSHFLTTTWTRGSWRNCGGMRASDSTATGP